MGVAHILVVMTMAAGQGTGAQGTFSTRMWPEVTMQRVESLKACQELSKTIEAMASDVSKNTAARVSSVRTECKPADSI